MVSINKKEDLFNLIIKKYDKRSSLIKAEAGEKELKENENNIDVLIARYVEECAGKVSKYKL